MMGALEFLYRTVPGRALLRVLVCRPVSRLCGKALETGASRALIPGFIRRAGIDVSEYDLSDIHCFNDFFCRPVKTGRRPVAMEPDALIAPCDGRVSVVPLEGDRAFPVKQSCWTVGALLRDNGLAEEFRDGICLVFRLQVDDYHRYCYFDSGEKHPGVFIPGKLHTVRPIALEGIPVFAENCREYTVIDTDSFGRAIQAEIGAMLVGRIVNVLPGAGRVTRGEEKGRFEYGGSTVLVLLRKGAASLREDILTASARGEEFPVRMGERIGSALTGAKED